MKQETAVIMRDGGSHFCLYKDVNYMNCLMWAIERSTPDFFSLKIGARCRMFLGDYNHYFKN